MRALIIIFCLASCGEINPIDRPEQRDERASGGFVLINDCGMWSAGHPNKPSPCKYPTTALKVQHER